jgi:acyl carrier protein
MGLEIVEIILRVEEEFSIEIQDKDAEQLHAPGDLCNLIEHKRDLYKASPATTMHCPTSRAFYSVRREMIKLGVERKHVTPQTSLATLWPPSGRRQNWKALALSLDYSLPNLNRPSYWTSIALLPLGVLPFWLQFFPGTATLYCVVYGLSWWLGTRLAEPLAVHPPNHLTSVADLCRSLAPRYITEDASLDLWPQVQALIADELDVPIEQVTRDADFYRDLGMR